MAEASLLSNISQPTLTALLVVEVTYTADITLPQPVLSGYVNDWYLATTLSAPTIAASLEVGSIFELAKTIPSISFTSRIETGRTFRADNLLRQPTLVTEIKSQVFYTLNKTLSPTLASFLRLDNQYHLIQTLRRPDLFALVANASSITVTTKTYVINTLNVAHTEYTNFNFNSYFKLGSKYYGVSSTGVYELTGNLDVASLISSEVHTPISSFDKQGLKACSDAILLGRLEGDMEVISVNDEQEEREGFIVREDNRPGLHRIRVKIPKGLKGAVWQFKLRNVDGGNFSVNNFEVFLRELQRIR